MATRTPPESLRDGYATLAPTGSDEQHGQDQGDGEERPTPARCELRTICGRTQVVRCSDAGQRQFDSSVNPAADADGMRTSFVAYQSALTGWSGGVDADSPLPSARRRRALARHSARRAENIEIPAAGELSDRVDTGCGPADG